MFEPLGRGRRKRKSPPPKVCMTPGCGRVLIHRWKWLCDGCFAALPYLRKKEICEARKPGQRRQARRRYQRRPVEEVADPTATARRQGSSRRTAGPEGQGARQPLKLAPFQKEFLEAGLADGSSRDPRHAPRQRQVVVRRRARRVGAVRRRRDRRAAGADRRDHHRAGHPVVLRRRGVDDQGRARAAAPVADLHRHRDPARHVPFNEGELFPISNDPDGLQGSTRRLAIIDEIGFQPQKSWDSLRMAPASGAGPHRGRRDARASTASNALFHIRKAVREGRTLPGLVFASTPHPTGARRRPQGVAGRQPGDQGRVPPRIGARDRPRHHARGPLPHLPPRPVVRGRRLVARGQRPRHVGRPAKPVGLRAGRPTWVGVDVGLKRDSTAVVAIQKREDGRLPPFAGFWLPTADEPVDVTDVMEHLRELDATPTTCARSASTPGSSMCRPRCSTTRACRWSRSRSRSSG
jgi:hypothetical protein